MKYLIPLGLALPYFGRYNFDAFHSKWFLGMAFCAVMVCWFLSKRFHWSTFPVFLITILGAVWYSESELHKYILWHKDDNAAIRQFTARTGQCVLLLASFFAFVPLKSLEQCFRWIGFFGFINSAYTICQWKVGEYPTGFIGNEAMNTGLIAITYPFLVWRGDYEKRFPMDGKFLIFIKEMGFVFVPIIAIALIRSHMAVGTFGVVLLSYLWCSSQIRFRTALVVMICELSVVAYYATKPGLDWKAITSGRWGLWEVLAQVWLVSGDHWFGQGPGTSYTLIGAIQEAKKYMPADHQYFWFLSDWLQVLFETGAVGVACFSLMFYHGLKMAKNRPWLFSSLCGWLAFAMGNYPARAFNHAFVGALILTAIFRGNSKNPSRDI